MQSPQPTLDARIPARHRRQAMDWSLVLASQGIEHRIDYDEATGWTLAVPEADYQKADAHRRGDGRAGIADLSAIDYAEAAN